MNQTELRIGNNVYLKLDINVETVICATDLMMLEEGKKHLLPIPLTKNWLLQHGFKQGDNTTTNDSFYEIPVGGSLLGINPDNGVVWITRGKNSFNNPALIESVHQLQNLYFALTNKELK